ncbi:MULTISPECIES: carboxylating nicotinate-nucleotide diphosphorylase [Desulfofundulus]|jgi:nicotinate-nucleotide pyrophosphorylase (carboxylating)|uniref:Probable nicotinate-nucleotide pyrophosphorylase [carboxylating] n=2 Tax=Desulfofundulus TaxID=2282741 RepID=A0A494WWE3_9FIRM|nr:MULTISPECIES: carboxylating nicotinate-nucleotide diphosphorylase [Desulfofundulus]AEG16716.1 nicotinate-nucleotide pyrophosphorylase [Desulfofundulus kuznetsovii DSM 6115]NHM28744.1 carboxylating nicotinate-nucleotide diphosphorylase [Desulfofundulus sp. TPOSR]RKO67829.1 carboxylating nicotinate-nucleotide diphosphorylase [Desulfofundulus salinum]
MQNIVLEDLIDRVLKEDIGTGDVTTNSIVPPDYTTIGFIHAKEPGVVAGLPVAGAVFRRLSPHISFQIRVREGERVQAGQLLARVEGEARAILSGERVALNLLQRMSGIATYTARLVELIREFKAKIVDTRKTTPGLRILEKYAVRVGGALNHRFGLYDAVLIKDNHIKVAGSITRAVELARANIPHTMKVEVEVEDLTGVEEALAAGADIIMLDNMDIPTMTRAVELAAGRAYLEASGRINEQNIVEVARTGVDFISLGALTHSARSLDISLDVGEMKPL